MADSDQETLWDAVGLPDPHDNPPPSTTRRIARVLCYATLALLAWLTWTYASHLVFTVMTAVLIFAFRGVQKAFGDL
jgi:hypothetical protein